MKISLYTAEFSGRQLPDGKNWIVEQPINFQVGDVVYTVPVGFQTDLTTLISEGRHTICAVIHD